MKMNVSWWINKKKENDKEKNEGSNLKGNELIKNGWFSKKLKVEKIRIKRETKQILNE
jgi:hypothetical protein